jgi:hypothetical protein
MVGLLLGSCGQVSRSDDVSQPPLTLSLPLPPSLLTLSPPLYRPLSLPPLLSVVNPHASTYPAAVKWMMYPRWWMESVGYWGQPFHPSPTRNTPVSVFPNSYPTLSSPEAYAEQYPQGIGKPYEKACYSAPESVVVDVTNSSFFNSSTALAFVAGIVLTLLLQYLKRDPTQSGGYTRISEDRGISMSSA